jgi:hypothetical protein
VRHRFGVDSAALYDRAPHFAHRILRSRDVAIGPICPDDLRSECQFPTNDFALRGRAGQPAPQAENRERGEREGRWNSATDCQPVPTAETSKIRKSQLALAIAQGKSIAVWARKNDVPNRTAYRWAAEPKVRAKIKSYHRRALGRAIGRLATRVTWASDGIAKLAENAESESVELAAL